MSLPTGTDLATLAYAKDGLPFATYQPSTANTTTLAYASNGEPFYAQGGGGGGGGGGPVVLPVSFFCT
jgi:hypothetical protein